jgi:transposase
LEAQLLEGAGDVFGADRDKSEAVDLMPLQAKIGQLTLENDFWLRRNKPFGQLLAFTEAGRF